MYDVTSKFYPNGGTANIKGTLSSATNIVSLKKFTIQGDIIEDYTGYTGATVAYIDPASGQLIPTSVTVDAFDYSFTPDPKLTLSGNIGPFSTADVELVFNYNPYYDHKFNADKDFLKDKFVRFSYRYKFLNGEYSLMAPFTQECFIPKQDGYFMYKVTGSRTDPPPLDIENEEDTYRSTIVEFMENKVDKVILRIPTPTSTGGQLITVGSLSRTAGVEEMDILYKESDSLSVNVLETIPVSTISRSYVYAFVNGTPTATTTIPIDGLSGVTPIEIKIGSIVTGTGITGTPVVLGTNIS